MKKHGHCQVQIESREIGFKGLFPNIGLLMMYPRQKCPNVHMILIHLYGVNKARSF
jgi:hypothetical protein